MAEQPGSGTLAGAADAAVGSNPNASPADPAQLIHEAFHGRPISWISVVIICIGFVIGGIAFVPALHWWLFWTGAGVALVGMALGALTKITEDWY